MPLPIPPEFERAVLERVRSGRYASTDEVLQACLEGLEILEEADEDLRRELQIGIEELERGEGIPAEEAYEMIRRWREDFPELAAGSTDEEPWTDVSLTPEMQRFVEEQVRSGRYASASAVMEAGLLLLQTEEEELRREIRVGLDQIEKGQVVDGEEAFARLRARIGRKVRR